MTDQDQERLKHLEQRVTQLTASFISVKVELHELKKQIKNENLRARYRNEHFPFDHLASSNS